jgi:signal transduction histidine kinase
MSTRARLTVSFTALFGVIVIALAIEAYLLVRNDAYSRLDAALQVATGATAMSAEHEFNEHSTKFAGEKDLQSVFDDTESSDVTDTQILVREENRNAAYKPGAQPTVDLRTIAPNRLRNGATLDGLQVATRTLRVPKFKAVYQIYSAKPITLPLEQLERIRISLFVLIPIGLGLAGLAGYFLAMRSLGPLQNLAQTIDRVTSSDLSARVEVNKEGDEIGTLGLRFNSLLDRLEDAFTVQRRFMADASHQIRTPVTVALTAAQVITRDPDANLPDYRESLLTIEHQMLQLRRTVEDMFFLSQEDSTSLKVDRKGVYLDDAVSEAVGAARVLANAKQQKLKVNHLAEAKCRGDEGLLKQAVLILLDNAVKFTPPGGNIDVDLLRRGEYWVCLVTDSGRGISEAAQARVFERFFRESRPGKEEAPGAGLGLAIAKSIIESHDGALTLVESRPGRTIFEIAIPVFETDLSPRGVHANSFAVRM